MQDPLDNAYQSQMDGLEIKPSKRVWDRLEKRLDQDEGKVPTSAAWRWSAAAACIGLLIGTFTFYHTHNTDMVFEDLDSMPKATFTAYRYVDQTHQIYHSWNWQNVADGEVRQMEEFSPNGIVPREENGRVKNARN